MADSPQIAPEQDAGAPQPRIQTLAQYVVDLSFENPNAPRSLQARADGDGPRINIQVNVNGNQVADNEFVVELLLNGDAKIENEVLFAFELKYATVLKLFDVPPEQVHPAVMIEGPRLVFPFARQIIADAVRNGGFPPLYIDPIDFAALYQQNVANQSAGAVPTT